jgi:flagellar M-ring protein FliF
VRTNYEINKVVKRIRGPSAVVKRLSIAVIVDGAYKTPANADKEKIDPENPPMEYVSRSKEEIETFRRLVAKAVEFDDTRGDQLEVANVQFSDEDTKIVEAQL